MRTIEPLQVKMIHAALAKLGIDDDDYRAILQGQFKKASCKDLTYVEASRLIDYFKTLGFNIPPRKRVTSGAPVRARRSDKVVVLPTRDQLKMIDVLAGKVAWRVEGGFQLWMKKYMKIERITSSWQAQRVIEGLKGLVAHQ